MAGGLARTVGLSPWLTVAAPVSLPPAIASSPLQASTFAHILSLPRQLFPPCPVLSLRSVRTSASLALFSGSGVSELPVGLWVFFFFSFLLKCQCAPSNTSHGLGARSQCTAMHSRQRLQIASLPPPCPAKSRAHRQCATGYRRATGYRCRSRSLSHVPASTPAPGASLEVAHIQSTRAAWCCGHESPFASPMPSSCPAPGTVTPSPTLSTKAGPRLLPHRPWRNLGKGKTAAASQGSEESVSAKILSPGHDAGSDP